MFNFTSTTVLNNNVDPTTGKARFEVIDGDDAILQIKRSLNIKASEVTNNQWLCYKAASIDATCAEAELDLTDATVQADKLFRLAVYVKLSGSLNSYYANDLVVKGKPFYVEASGAADAEGLATMLVANAAKYKQLTYEYDMINLKAADGVITITATDEYQRFAKVELQEWEPETSVDGEWVVAVAGEITEVGNEGFGTYVHLTKDLRLPTAANTRWNRIAIDETPIPGVTYAQYTFYFCKDRGVLGTDAVGDLVTSKTCHVFWVNESLEDDFDAALGEVGLTPTAAPQA